MNLIENKIKSADSMFDNTEVPSAQNMMENVILSNRGKKVFLFAKRLALIAAIILIVISITGATVYNNEVYYYFAEGRRGFGKAQDDGYINVVNKSETHNDITFRVTAIFSDGLQTYVRIAFDGGLPSCLRVDPDEKHTRGDLFLDSISEATLSDDNGQSWNFKYQELSSDGGGSSGVLSPDLSWPSLPKNERVLLFYNTNVSDTVKFSLDIKFNGIEDAFRIKDMKTKIAPKIIRDFSNDNIFYKMQNAKIQVLSTTSTYLNTVFKLKWTVTKGIAQSQSDYCSEYSFEFKYDDVSIQTFTFMTNLGDADFSSGQAETYSYNTLGIPLPTDKQITVNLVKREGGKWKFVETLFVIPAKN